MRGLENLQSILLGPVTSAMLPREILERLDKIGAYAEVGLRDIVKGDRAG